MLFGNLSGFTKDPLAFLDQCAREHGDFVPVRFFNKTVVIVNDHDAIEEIMLTRSKNFTKMTGYQTPFIGRVFGNGLLTSEGAFWVRQRKMSQPAFHRQRLVAYAPMIVELADEMLKEWKSGEERATHTDLSHLTAKVIIKALFSTPVPEAIWEFDRMSLEAMKRVAKQKNIFWMLLSMIPNDFSKRFEVMMKNVDDFVYQSIKEHRATPDPAHWDVLSMLIDARDDQGNGMTDLQLRDELMTLITAGLDTTVLSMTWACYLLAKNPAAQDRLQEELRTVLGGRLPTFADLANLKYTEAVLRESMRLFPPAWVVTREAAVDCTIGGYAFPKGTAVMMSQWTKHRDGRVFERPEEFDPSRWLGQRTLPKFAYFPFGGGPRLCLGSGLAMMEAPLGMATICQKFRFECDPGYTVKPWASITLHPWGGMKLRVQAV